MRLGKKRPTQAKTPGKPPPLSSVRSSPRPSSMSRNGARVAKAPTMSRPSLTMIRPTMTRGTTMVVGTVTR